MNKSWWALATALLFALAGLATAAVSKGGQLYVRTRNTRVLKKPAGSEVLATLQPGATVKWHGANATKPWHDVEVDGKKGVVLAGNLSTHPPQQELVASKDGAAKKVDPQAFASSGAATKALGAAAVNYGNKTRKNSVAELATTEGIAVQVTEDALKAQQAAVEKARTK